MRTPYLEYEDLPLPKPKIERYSAPPSPDRDTSSHDNPGSRMDKDLIHKIRDLLKTNPLAQA